MATPWMTSRDVINAIKRKIMFPLSQNTLSEADVLAFANEEMMISQVPGVIQFHQEYFVFSRDYPLISNISRYAVPDRAIGMRLRDVFYRDENNNLFEMARVSADDKSFYQRGASDITSVAKYYLEGNEIVLVPPVQDSPTGSLNISVFLRPNQLVDDTRAAIIENFLKTIEVDASEVTLGDLVEITTAQNTQSPITENFVATQRVITSNSVATATVVTCAAPHGQEVASTFTVVISEVSGSTPTINGTYTATATGANTFTIPVNVTVGGTGGYFSLDNEFTIGTTDAQTADNLAASIGAVLSSVTTSSVDETLTISYTDITLEVEITQASTGLTYDGDYTFINFDQLPSTWTNPTTNVTESLYTNGCLVDFLQTKPGHRTYNYDVELISASGTVGQFLHTELEGLPIIVGDYICLENECIIPQIPPDLHTGLCERTSARILAAIGDQQGLDRINTKIQEIDGSQGTLLSSRVDGSPQKITARHSHLRNTRRRCY